MSALARSQNSDTEVQDIFTGREELGAGGGEVKAAGSSSKWHLGWKLS